MKYFVDVRRIAQQADFCIYHHHYKNINNNICAPPLIGIFGRKDEHNNRTKENRLCRITKGMATRRSATEIRPVCWKSRCFLLQVIISISATPSPPLPFLHLAVQKTAPPFSVYKLRKE